MWWMDEYEEIDGICNGGYDWDEFRFLRKKDTGELFVGYGSGCSCVGFEDVVSPEDLTPVKNWQEAVEEAKGYITEYGVTEAEVFEFANRLAQRLDL
jgi:hypothetical protein